MRHFELRKIKTGFDLKIDLLLHLMTILFAENEMVKFLVWENEWEKFYKI